MRRAWVQHKVTIAIAKSSKGTGPIELGRHEQHQYPILLPFRELSSP